MLRTWLVNGKRRDSIRSIIICQLGAKVAVVVLAYSLAEELDTDGSSR